MRFVQDFGHETLGLLKRIHKYSQYYRTRQRAHCMILSSQGYSTTQLQDIFQVDRITIYHWFNAWESRQFCGLYDKKGGGRPPKLNSDHQEKIRQWIKLFPKNLNQIRALIKEEFDIEVSKQTLKRILRMLNFSWHRIRRKVKGKPDPDEYKWKKDALDVFKQQEDDGLIDLFYYDESGFCLVVPMPYAWQEQDCPIEVESGRSPRLNIVGFMSRKNELQAYSVEGYVNSDSVIDCFDKFCKTVTRKTVIVMDNASIHKSEAFERKQAEWAQQDVDLFFLPKYSPELNLIEILWRFMKYEWIDFEAYTSWQKFVTYIETILHGFGYEYEISFR